MYPGNVLALYMSKPQGFKYTSGQYIFVNCSDVSPFQWYAPKYICLEFLDIVAVIYIYYYSIEEGDHEQS